MFLKIYKHSFLAALKTILPLLIIQPSLGILGGICAKIAEANKDNTYLSTIFTFISSMSTFAISIIAFVEVVVVISSFKKAVANDEAYLTYTLPATAGQQLGARTLSIATWLVISMAMAWLSTIIYLAIASGLSLRPDVGSSSGNLTGDDALLVFEVILLAIILAVSILFHLVFSVLLAQKLSTRTKTKSANVMTGVIGFCEAMFILFIFISVLIGLVENDGVASMTKVHVALWVLIVIFAITGGLCYFLSYKFMSRWLNLE